MRKLILAFTGFLTNPFCFAETGPTSFSILSMGLQWDFRFSQPLSGSLTSKNWEEKIGKQLQNYDEIFSEWNPASQLRKFESKGWQTWQTFGPEWQEIFELSQIFFNSTEGLFDPTVGGLNFSDSPKRQGDWGNLDWTRWKNNQIRFLQNPGRLSFSGLLKGFLVAEFATQFILEGSRFFSIDAGGGNLCQVENHLVLFESRSSLLDTSGKQHIWNPQNQQKSSSKKNSKIQCSLDLRNLELKTLREKMIFLGSASDVYSTVSLIGPNLPLPKNCRAD